MGVSGRDLQLTFSQTSVDHRGSHLQDAMNTVRRPAHLSALVHARVDQTVHNKFRAGCRDPQSSPVTSTVVDKRRRIHRQVGLQFAGELGEALDASLPALAVEPDCVASHVCDAPQRATGFLTVTIPNQMAQPRDIDLYVSQWAFVLQVCAEKTGKCLLDMPHAHRNVDVVLPLMTGPRFHQNNGLRLLLIPDYHANSGISCLRCHKSGILAAHVAARFTPMSDNSVGNDPAWVEACHSPSARSCHPGRGRFLRAVLRSRRTVDCSDPDSGDCSNTRNLWPKTDATASNDRLTYGV